MTTLLLGNAAPIDVVKTLDEKRDAEIVTRHQRADLGAQVTVFEIPDDHVSSADLEAIAGHPRWGARMRGMPERQRRFYLHRELVDDAWWTAHSDDPPEWVECDDEPELAQVIADHFTTGTHTCRVGRSRSWKEGRPLPANYAGRGSKAIGGAGLLDVTVHYLEPDEFAWRSRELRTNGGTDIAFAQMFGTAAQPAAANYIAVTANVTAPAATDTTLTAEITTAGGGLVRKQAAYSHTNGTNTGALSATFTANGTDALPVTLGKFGVFNGTGAVTMAYETLISPTATLSASGDNMALTDTFTLT